MPKITFIAGEHVYDLLQKETQLKVKPGMRPGTFDSNELCKLHIEQHNRGFIGVELVKTIYGYSVRYDTGLRNFGIVAACRSGQLNGSFEDAARYAKAWCANDPEHRYAFVRTM